MKTFIVAVWLSAGTPSLMAKEEFEISNHDGPCFTGVESIGSDVIYIFENKNISWRAGGRTTKLSIKGQNVVFEWDDGKIRTKVPVDVITNLDDVKEAEIRFASFNDGLFFYWRETFKFSIGRFGLSRVILNEGPPARVSHFCSGKFGYEVLH